MSLFLLLSSSVLCPVFLFFFLSFILTKSFSRDRPLVVKVFKRQSTWLNYWTQRSNVFWGSLQEVKFASWCNHWTQRSNVLWGSLQEVEFASWCNHWTQRSNFLWGSLQEVGLPLGVITKHKGGRSFGVHCKKWNLLLGVNTEHKGGKSFVVHCL